MKRKKRIYSEKVGRLPAILFSFEALSLVRDSFVVFEETLKRNTGCDPHHPFAQVTFAQVRRKVDEMLLLRELAGEVTFDENELIIDRTCLQMYTADLLCKKSTPARDQLLARCFQVQQLLSPQNSQGVS